MKCVFWGKWQQRRIFTWDRQTYGSSDRSAEARSISVFARFILKYVLQTRAECSRSEAQKQSEAKSFYFPSSFCSAMSPFGIGVLDKVDGVGTRAGILVHLEVVGWKSKRSEDKIPQVLQFTCSGVRHNGVTSNMKIHQSILKYEWPATLT